MLRSPDPKPPEISLGSLRGAEVAHAGARMALPLRAMLRAKANWRTGPWRMCRCEALSRSLALAPRSVSSRCYSGPSKPEATRTDEGSKLPRLRPSCHVPSGASPGHRKKDAPIEPLMADARIFLIAGALLCFGGSLYSVYVAVTHDPNRKEDRPILKRGEYIGGASIVGALVMTYVILRR
ncbi:unnamed protein product [Durusdinium trenchii]|uniref:Uncharacterized protein n=2 Tax=Durusdinium trenchii TaxID=1381693 RepID=A0ABP0QGB4_9DINO